MLLEDELDFTTRLANVLNQLAELRSSEVLLLGPIEVELHHFFPEIVTLEAIITGTRREHYLSKHPEIGSFERFVIRAALRPEEIHIDQFREDTFNHYVSIDSSHDVRVALRYAREVDRQHSVITAMVTRKRDRKSGEKKGKRVWER